MEKALAGFEVNLATSSPGMTYLEGRGITAATAARFRLGVVSSDAPPTYQKYVGRLAIPYIDRLGVSGLKYRCLQHDDCKEHGCVKYLNPVGQETEIFRPIDCEDDESDTLHWCEGEMDKICLSQYVSDPILATPGAEAWEDRWRCHFAGFARVIGWKHGDRAGDKWAKRLRDNCRNAEIVELPPGEDVNSLILLWGAEKVVELANGGEEE